VTPASLSSASRGVPSHALRMTVGGDGAICQLACVEVLRTTARWMGRNYPSIHIHLSIEMGKPCRCGDHLLRSTMEPAGDVSGVAVRDTY
jgi:hypothetical protein